MMAVMLLLFACCVYTNSWDVYFTNPGFLLFHDFLQMFKPSFGNIQGLNFYNSHL